jgi:hypothetical protein
MAHRLGDIDFLMSFLFSYIADDFERLIRKVRNISPRISIDVAFCAKLHVIFENQLMSKKLKKSALCRAIRAGDLDLFWWAHKNDRAGTYKMDFCAGAAYGGNLKVLQWARENGYPWDSTTCANAAAGGHLHVLKWARANSCPWDIYNVYACCWGRQFRGTAVGKAQWMWVEQTDLHLRSTRWSLRSATVGERK